MKTKLTSTLTTLLILNTSATYAENAQPTEELKALTRSTDELNEAKAALNTAKAELEIAKKELSTTRTSIKTSLDQQTKELEKEANIEKATELIRQGVNVGVGYTFNMDIPTNSKNFSLSRSVTPYIALYPAYWFGGPSENIYCAHKFFLDQNPQKSADEFTRETSKPKDTYKITKDYIKQIDIKLSADNNVPKNSSLQSDLEKVKNTINNGEKTLEQLQKDDIDTYEAFLNIHAYMTKGWQVGVPAGCLAESFGIYIGIPVNDRTFQFDAAGTSKDVIKRNAKPIASIGLIVSPFYNIGIPIGVSFWNREGTNKKTIVSPTLDLGISAQFDVTSVFK